MEDGCFRHQNKRDRSSGGTFLGHNGLMSV